MRFGRTMRKVNPAIRQQKLNGSTRGNWDAFAEHRARLMELIEESVAPEARASLCILGAGNCNDLDLPRLVSQWPHIRLVDLDMEAMRAGVAKQFHLSLPAQLELSTLDVTGGLEYCHELIHGPSRETLTRLRQALTMLPAVERLGERFSCVVSACLMSQLMDTMKHALGESSPDLPGLIQMVRLQHLRTLAELTAPGGVMITLVDFVSSDSLPQVPHASGSSLPALMAQSLGQSNFFLGTNPLAIQQLLNGPLLGSYWREPVEVAGPWRWNLGPRMYLVAALVGHRA